MLVRASTSSLACAQSLKPLSNARANSKALEECIEKGHQRDANLCGAYAHPTDERSLMRGTGGYNEGSCVYFAKECGGWVFAGVNGVG